MTGTPNELVLEAPIAVRSILRRSAPRIVRDALGPLASFFIAWKLAGLVVGIFCATAFALVMYRRERRRGRPAVIVRVALGLVLLRAVVGLITGDAKAYLGQDVAIDAALGLAVMGSVVVGRPLGELFAREVYPFPDQVRQSDRHKLLIASLDDKYGSYGKIGLALIECLRDVWNVKLLLMSCRVMSRGVGMVMINHILQMAKERQVKLYADFVSNNRNRMMYVTYKFAGFKEIEKRSETIVFENDLTRIQPFPPYMQVTIL